MPRLRSTTRMVRLAGAVLLFVLGTRSLFAQSASAAYMVGHAAPDFKLKDLDGKQVQLSSLRGKVVLLDFWASWCGPCRVEIPIIESISKHFKNKDVLVLGVNSQEPAEVVRSFVAKNKITYPVVLTVDNPGIIRAYSADALPTAVLVDKTGIIAAYRIGENPSTEEILRDDLHRVLSPKYVPPQPKPVQFAQAGAPAMNTPARSQASGPDANWQPKTADEFIARGYAYLRVHNNGQAKADAEDALKLRPDCFEAVFLHGRAAYESKDYSVAIADFDKVIEQKPDWRQAYEYRALAYSYHGEHQRALPDDQKFISLDPYSAAAYNNTGWAYRELGDLDKAKTNLDKAIELSPDYIRARENRAILYEKQGNRAAEMDEIARILEIAPNDQWAKNHRLGVPSEETPRPDTAPRLISKIEPQYTEEARRAGISTVILCALVVSAEGVPEDIQVLRGAGFGLDENAVKAVSTWRFEPAKKDGAPVRYPARVEVSFRLPWSSHERQNARLNFSLPTGVVRPELMAGHMPENSKDSNGRMRIALTVGTDGATQDLSVLETTSPEWSERAVHEMGKWRFRPAAQNGQSVAVKGVLEIEAAQMPFAPTNSAAAPAGPDPNWQPKSADEFLARGYARLAAHKYPQAEADAEDALKLKPDCVMAEYLHGRAAYDTKEYAVAIEDFDKVIQQRPNWAEPYRFRGLAYSYNGQHERAVPDYQKAIQLDPYLAHAYNALGWALTEMGQLDQARMNLDKAIEIEPDFILARKNRAKLFGKLHDLNAEQNELSVILGLVPNDQWAKDNSEAVSQQLGGR